MIDKPALLLRGVEVRRNTRLALAIPELTVAPGEVVAVMGPNGAGKSTLLEVAALLRRPDTGEIAIGGEVATRRNERALRRRLAMVFQAALLFDLSVRENVAAGPRFRGVPRREAERRAHDWLDRFGVGELAGRSGRELSGGEAQRVSLARAFATEPTLLLLDEPFAALDAPTRATLVPTLAARLRQAGVAALIATHDRAEALAFADRLVVLLDGRVAQIGPPAVVIAAPESPVIAALLTPESWMTTAAPIAGRHDRRAGAD